MHRFVCSCLALACAASGAIAQSQRTYILDFEEFAEDTEMTTQYQRWGVTFSAVGRTRGPIVAREGAPRRSHANSNGGDDPRMPSGVNGLTDPLIGGDYAVPSNLQLDFNPPITSLRLYVVDIDNTDVVTLRAFRNGAEVDSETHRGGEADVTGDAVSTLFTLSADAIDRVVVEVNAPPTTVGYGIDFISFTRACGVVPCRAPDVRVWQERTAGAGDFVQLGTIGYFLTSASASEIYAYGVPDGDSYNGPLISPVTDRSHIVLADTSDGVTMMVVHDNPVPNNNGGGKAEMRFTLEGDCSRTFRSVADDPTTGGDAYTGVLGDCAFTSRHEWTGENTDGISISGLDPYGRLYVSFDEVNNNPNSPPIQSLTEWYAYSSGGLPIQLELAVGKRVRFDLVPPCPADFNNDNFLDFFDVDDFTLAFDNGSPRADFNADGFVDFFDFNDFVEAFELGC
jgi:hypothetical protein